MKATVYHGARDIRFEDVPDPAIRDPQDAIVRVARAAICGSDLWFYRGVTSLKAGALTGHEFVGNVEEVGPDVRTVRAGDAVIAPFAFSDGTCEFCPNGLQTLINMFYKSVGVQGGPAPVRAHLPRLIESLAAGRIDPSPVLDLSVPLDRVAEGYAAMDERRAIKVLLSVSLARESNGRTI